MEEMEKTFKNKKNNNDEDDVLEEHLFLATSLKLGLRLDDLKELEYKDVAKIMLCLIKQEKEENGTRKATQADWDKLAGRR